MEQITQFTEEVFQAFSWLSQEEAREVAEGLDKESDARLSAKPQMEKFANLLDRFGLRVTAPLLMALSGRGSKGAAVDVVRELSRRRFDEAKKIRTDLDVVPDKLRVDISRPAAGEHIDVSTLVDAVSREVTEIMQNALDKFSSLPALQNAARMLEVTAGDVNWLKSTIDTERQLRRHVEINGVLPEPAAPSASDPAKARRAIVAVLSESLQESKVFSTKNSHQPGHTRHLDEMDHRE